MKKFLFFIIVICLILPNMAEAGKFRAKGWFYACVLDGTIGLPPSFSIGKLRFAIGFAPPYGFGIGTALLKHIGSTFSRSHDDQIISGLFPVYLYYVPYVSWQKGQSVNYAAPIVYTYI